MRKELANVLGWYGAIASLLGYALISFGWLNAQGAAYQGIIVTSTAGLTIISLHKKLYQTALLNAVSVTIGLVALARIVF
jgi:predicted membrane-bound spermidine synthase